MTRYGSLLKLWSIVRARRSSVAWPWTSVGGSIEVNFGAITEISIRSLLSHLKIDPLENLSHDD